jgi:SOS-response transcriptional repressor LexA
MNEKPKAKVIPISAVVQEPKSAEAEIHGCAELEPYALRVLGDSMAPEFLEGHVVIVDPGMPLTHGAYVVIDYQSETTFRQYWVEGERKFLKAVNEAYPMVEITESFRVRGVVTQRAGRRRSQHKRYD